MSARRSALRRARQLDAAVTNNAITIDHGFAPTTGGAISNAGKLTITNSFITTNKAVGGVGANASGGAIYNTGTLSIDGCNVNSNTVLVGNGDDTVVGTPGGNAYG